MKTTFPVEEVLDSPSKLAILRLFVSHKGFRATGRQIAHRIGYSAPSTHDSLKRLQEHNILELEIVGNQHIYSLNDTHRVVQKMIRPLFAAEGNIKNEIRDFLLHELSRAGLKAKIASLILFGSVQAGTAGRSSDVDVAAVVVHQTDVLSVEQAFLGHIASQFKSYFGVQVHPYIKSASEFRERMKKNLPPVSTLMKSYAVLYGKEPLEV